MMPRIKRTDRSFAWRIPAAALSAMLLASILLAAVIPASLRAETPAPGAAAAAVYAGAPEPAAAAISVYETAAAVQQPASRLPKAASLPYAVADATPPVFTTVSPAGGSLNGPAITAAAEFYDPEPGSGIATATAMIHIDGRHQAGCAVTGSSITCLKSGLTDGQHTLEAFVCDQQTNCNSLIWSITVDASPPVISDTEPSGTINSRSAYVRAAFADAGSSGVDPGSASVILDGLQVTDSCAITAAGADCPLVDLAQGPHAVTVEIADTLGNRSSRSWTFTVDTGAIGITGQRPAHGSWLTAASPQIGAQFQAAGTGTVLPGSVGVLLDGQDMRDMFECRTDGIDSLPDMAPLGEGWHTVSVTVDDDGGHHGNAQWSFGVDTLSPSVGQLAPMGTAPRQPAISATYTDGGSGVNPASVRISLDGADATDSASVSNAQVTYSPAHPLPAGVHQVQLTVADLAGNLRSSGWSFSVPAESSIPAPANAAQASGRGLLTAYLPGSNPLFARAGGSWIIGGLNALSRQYHLPWFGTEAAGIGAADELLIKNAGAGEAHVRVLISGHEEWTLAIAEGESRTLSAGTGTGGPLKVLSDTGQKLEVIQRPAGAGPGRETKALAGEELEPVLLLPWHEALPLKQGKAELLLANPGPLPAEAEVYIGDPATDGSLLGVFSLAPDSALRTALPAVSGGPIRIISTTANQPLTAALERSTGGAMIRTLAAGFSRLKDRYLITPGDYGKTDTGALQLQMGNGNARDIRVEVRAGGELLEDPQSGEESFLIPGQSARTLTFDGGRQELEIICLDCGPGEGVAAGFSS